jgi:radical SAM protein with 4Fe4S-binding SPASM domain
MDGASPAPKLYPREIRAEDRSRPHPLYCVWEITLACDLGCKHCGSRAGKDREGELDTAECLDIVRQLDEIGFREVTLIGGEAYLREDWDQIAKEITRRGMTCGITTGARFFSEERLSRAVEAGIGSISVSIDGLERTHDAQRGVHGSWLAATDAARRIAKTPIRLATNTQINRLSLPEIPALADLLADLGSKAWQIQLTVPMGRGADRSRLLLQPYELLPLFPLLVRVKEERLDPRGVTLFPGNNIGYFGPYEGALRFHGKDGAHWAGCPAGEWSIGLEADGKIKACPSLPSKDYTGGNTREVPIAEAVERAKEINFLKQRTGRDLWGYCAGCYYADICKAGCTWTSQVFMGKPGNNPYCIHRALDRQRHGEFERFVKVEEAPGLPFDQGRFELVVEPLPPGGLEPDLSGFTVQQAMELDWRSGGLWSDAELERALARDRQRSGLPILG